jgi:hypothetical protein
MKSLIFASVAFVLLLPFLKFIPVKLSLKQKAVLSALSFCITILALIGKEFLPFISMMAILVLLTGLTAYIAQSRIRIESTVKHHEFHPDPHFPAASHHEPENYETVTDAYESRDKTVSESNLQEGASEDFIKEDEEDYIKELEWDKPEVERLDPDAVHAPVYEDDLPLIDKELPGEIEAPLETDEEEEEYNRLFSGIKRR